MLEQRKHVEAGSHMVLNVKDINIDANGRRVIDIGNVGSDSIISFEYLSLPKIKTNSSSFWSGQLDESTQHDNNEQEIWVIFHEPVGNNVRLSNLPNIEFKDTVGKALVIAGATDEIIALKNIGSQSVLQADKDITIAGNLGKYARVHSIHGSVTASYLDDYAQVISIDGDVNTGDLGGMAKAISINGTVNTGFLSIKAEAYSINGTVNTGSLGIKAKAYSINGAVTTGSLKSNASAASISGDVMTKALHNSAKALSVTGNVTTGVLGRDAEAASNTGRVKSGNTKKNTSKKSQHSKTKGRKISITQSGNFSYGNKGGIFGIIGTPPSGRITVIQENNVAISKDDMTKEERDEVFAKFMNT